MSYTTSFITYGLKINRSENYINNENNYNPQNNSECGKREVLDNNNADQRRTNKIVFDNYNDYKTTKTKPTKLPNYKPNIMKF